MLKPGPAPKPAQLKIQRGNPGHRPINDDELSIPTHAPERPDHLTDEARAEWDRIVPILLRFRLVSDLDTASLAMYCQSYGRWQQAERKLQEMAKQSGDDAMLIKAPSGYPIKNPYLSIAEKAMDDCARYLAQFGLSPSARTRVTPAPLQLEMFEGCAGQWQAL